MNWTRLDKIPRGARAVPGYESLYVTRSADVISTMYERPVKLTPFIKPLSGHRSVAITRGGEQVQTTVATLVALAFCGPRPTPAHQARRKNGKPLDDRACNVEWAIPH